EEVTTAQDTPQTITLTGSDPNSPPRPLTYMVTTQPTHGTLPGTAPRVTYAPAASYFGPDRFQFKVNNVILGRALASNAITVVGPPTANPQTTTTAQGTAQAITLTGSDPNSPARPLTYTIITQPAHGTLSGTAPSVTYTPATSYFGQDRFQFKVNNG